MFSVCGKSVSAFVARMAIFVYPQLLVEYLLAHTENLEIFMRLKDYILSVFLCMFEILNEMTIQAWSRNVEFFNFVMIMDIEYFQFFYHC